MRLGLHLSIVAGLLAPLELDHWLWSDLIPVNATVVESRIIAPPRPRVSPIVSVELSYVVHGHEHRTSILTLEPADGRFNWRPEEQAAAERYVREHSPGASVMLWVPRALPGYGAMLADARDPPDFQPRSRAHLAYLCALAAYLGGALIFSLAQRRGRASHR